MNTQKQEKEEKAGENIELKILITNLRAQLEQKSKELAGNISEIVKKYFITNNYFY